MVVTSHCIRQQFSRIQTFSTPRLTRALSRLTEMTRSPNNRGSCCLLIVLVASLVFALSYAPPVKNLFRHMKFYSPAEQMVGDLILPFSMELRTNEGVSIDELLQASKYKSLKDRVMNVDLNDRERIRFHVNEMFDIGVIEDGSIQWYVNTD